MFRGGPIPKWFVDIIRKLLESSVQEFLIGSVPRPCILSTVSMSLLDLSLERVHYL